MGSAGITVRSNYWVVLVSLLEVITGGAGITVRSNYWVVLVSLLEVIIG